MDGILRHRRECGGIAAARPGTDAELEEAKQVALQLKRGDTCIYHAHCRLKFETFRKFGWKKKKGGDDDAQSLGFFGVYDGMTIYMNEVYLKAVEREKEAWAAEQRKRCVRIV